MSTDGLPSFPRDTYGDNPVSRMPDGDSRVGGSVSYMRDHGISGFDVHLRARRYLDRQRSQLWAHFHLSDDRSFEEACDWLERTVIGVLESDRDEAKAKAESVAAGREFDRQRGQFIYTRFDRDAL